MGDDRGMPLDSDMCECGKLKIDHTIRELRECSPAEALNLPYEESGAITWQRVADEHGDIASAMVVKAAALAVDHAIPGVPRTLPALAFHFFGMDGTTTVAKALLVLDESHMRDVRRLVGDSIDGAIKAARRTR